MPPKNTAQAASASPATASDKPPNQAPAPAAASDVLVAGHAIQVLAFVPDTADKRAHGQLVILLADIEDGKAGLAELAPFVKNPKLKVEHLRRRMSKAERDALLAPASAAAPAPNPPPATHQEGDAKQDE